jgi:hypothetical protein
MSLLRKSSLESTDGGVDAGEVLLLPLLVAPALMVAATAAERRFGSAVAGWIGAAPTTIVIAVLAVGADLGPRAGAALATTAATHVIAQVAFAVAFATVMVRRGGLAGLLAGTAAFAGVSLLVAGVPATAATAAAIPALLIGPRVLPDHGAEPTGADDRRYRDTAIRAAVASIAVGAVLAVAGLAGPSAAGMIGAYPALSTALVLLIVPSRGTRAAADALAGLVRGLPGYLTFCLAVAIAAPFVGVLVAVPLSLGVCLVTYGVTYPGLTQPTIPESVAPCAGSQDFSASSRLRRRPRRQSPRRPATG